MDCDEADNAGVKSIDETSAVVNSVILDYYKKFGRKRDLEQFFSLSSAESEVRDVTSLFWRRMKSQTDSSDSGERKSKSESSTELCRISIKCSLPEPCSSSQVWSYYLLFVSTSSSKALKKVTIFYKLSSHSFHSMLYLDSCSYSDFLISTACKKLTYNLRLTLYKSK